jgi:hypothetical protein
MSITERFSINEPTSPGLVCDFEFKPVKRRVPSGHNPWTGVTYWKTVTVDDGTPSSKKKKTETKPQSPHPEPAQQPVRDKDHWRTNAPIPD